MNGEHHFGHLHCHEGDEHSCAHENCGCNGGEEDLRKELAKLVAAACIFLAGIAVEKFFAEKFGAVSASLPFCIAAFAVCGCGTIVGSLSNAVRGRFFDEVTLMSVASVSAFVLGKSGEAFAIMFFYRVGELFQDAAVDKSRAKIRALLEERPLFAWAEREMSLKKVKPGEVRVGEIVVVKPGEKIPLDGKVAEGETFVNESMMTGESVPVRKSCGDSVFAGTLNGGGLVKIVVTAVEADSSVAKIAELVENSEERKAKGEKFIRKFAKIYTPAIFFLAVLVAVLPPFFLGGNMKNWLYKSLVLLVVACPCALVISIPLAFFAGLACAAKNGILVKGGEFLEKLRNAKTFAFDKTGTLTQGIFEVSDVVCENGADKNRVLRTAAVIEKNSRHPIAEAICRNAGDFGVDEDMADFQEIPGRGVSVRIGGRELRVGNAAMMDGISNFHPLDVDGTCVYVSDGGKFLGAIVASDLVRHDAVASLAEMRRRGVKNFFIISGDNHAPVKAAAERLGIEETFSNLKPDEKLAAVERLKARFGDIAFVGDGINDAPVMAFADVSVAMGGGSDSAVDAADIVVVGDDLQKIPLAMQIAQKVGRIVFENVAFTLAAKAAVAVFAIFAEVPVPLAVFADVGVALLAVFNAMRAFAV